MLLVVTRKIVEIILIERMIQHTLNHKRIPMFLKTDNHALKTSILGDARGSPILDDVSYSGPRFTTFGGDGRPGPYREPKKGTRQLTRAGLVLGMY